MKGSILIPAREDGKPCGKPVLGAGMCSMHYARNQRYGDPLHKMRRYIRQGDECAHQGCDEKPKRRGFCEKHASRDERHGTTEDPRQRKFWAQVDKSGGPVACWPWTGQVSRTGYAQFGSHGTRLAHRIACQFAVGPIPDGLVLDHLCHTADPQCADTSKCLHRRCCNPEHLEPVTPRQNIERGRGGDSWGYVPEVAAKPRPPKPTTCIKCGRTDKPVYKSGMCRPCYRKWLKDPEAERPSQRTPEQRFWAKVAKTKTCWLWTASVNQGTGYAQFFPRHGEPMDAHRFSYEMHHGPIPEGHDVHHTCHVRHCVNPSHLEAVTRSENLRMRKYRR